MSTTGFTKFAIASLAAAAVGLGALATAATAEKALPTVTVAPPPAAQQTTVGQPFLPAYLEMLQGRQPFAQDTCAQPRNLQELLIPCDQGGGPR